MPQVTRLDYTGVIPMTVQNIMLEHMQEQGMSRKGANDALIGIASEMRSWGFEVKDKGGSDEAY